MTEPFVADAGERPLAADAAAIEATFLGQPTAPVALEITVLGVFTITTSFAAPAECEERSECDECSHPPEEHSDSLVSARMAQEPVAEGPRKLPEGIEVRPAREDEIDDLMPLMRAYCEFYESSPTDEGVVEMLRTLITDSSQGAVFIAC